MVACHWNQATWGWESLQKELLDNIKDILEQSESKDGSKPETMQNLRLVNRHWSAWATEATRLLRAPRYSIPMGLFVDQAAQSFVHLQSLQLEGMRMIADDGLCNLLKLPKLTSLDLAPGDRICAREITDEGMGYLGRLTGLKCLKLCYCSHITDVGVRHLSSLFLLTKLYLSLIAILQTKVCLIWGI